MTAKKLALVLGLLFAVAPLTAATAGVSHSTSALQIDASKDADNSTYSFQILGTDGTTSKFSVTPGGNVSVAGTLATSGALSYTGLGTESVSIAPGTLYGTGYPGNSSEVSVSVPGAAVGDAVILGPPSNIDQNLTWYAYVSATGTVKVRFANTALTGSQGVFGAKTWKIKLVH